MSRGKRGPMSPEQKEAMKLARKNRVIQEEKILPITEKYRIVSDLIEYRLEEKTKGGNWKVIGHHSRISSVIDSIGEHVTKDDLDALLFVSKQLQKIHDIVSQYDNLDKIKM